MTHELAYKAIEERLEAQWITAPATPRTPILWDNAPGEPPADNPWVRATLLPGQAEKIDLGVPGRYRHPGVLDIQIFSPIQKGVRALTALADHMATIWRSVTVSGIVFRTPSLYRVGDTTDGWFQMNVSVPYRWDETF